MRRPRRSMIWQEAGRGPGFGAHKPRNVLISVNTHRWRSRLSLHKRDVAHKSGCYREPEQGQGHRLYKAILRT